jgi:hypothetical protein
MSVNLTTGVVSQRRAVKIEVKHGAHIGGCLLADLLSLSLSLLLSLTGRSLLRCLLGGGRCGCFGLFGFIT